MNQRRVGLWLIGALGGVGSTAALGLAALAKKATDPTSLVTALPLFAKVDFDSFDSFVVGGHDIRQSCFKDSIHDFQKRANIFDRDLTDLCQETLAEWSANVRPGTIVNSGKSISQLADAPGVMAEQGYRQVMDRIQKDLREFKEKNRLDQVVVVNVSSTEPPFELSEIHQTSAALSAAIAKNQAKLLPASSLYAWASLELGWPYVNFTPSLGASVPALLSIALEHRAAIAGKDGKTGETLLKSVLAPMFAARNWQILSWVGHNIFGNRDGQVLDNPENKSSKIKTKDALIAQIVGYKPQTLVTIEYIESLDDWKTAWNHIHFQGFLGTKMTMQFTWQGCDSILAGPLVIDLARLVLLAERRGEWGPLTHLASFFKNPVGVADHDFFKQFALLTAYAEKCSKA